MSRINKKPAKTIDISGKVCPYTLVDTNRALKNMKKGEVLEVLSDYEPAVRSTIPSMCDKKGYPYEVHELEKGKKWQMLIQKTDNI